MKCTRMLKKKRRQGDMLKIVWYCNVNTIEVFHIKKCIQLYSN